MLGKSSLKGPKACIPLWLSSIESSDGSAHLLCTVPGYPHDLPGDTTPAVLFKEPRHTTTTQREPIAVLFATGFGATPNANTPIPPRSQHLSAACCCHATRLYSRCCGGRPKSGARGSQTSARSRALKARTWTTLRCPGNVAREVICGVARRDDRASPDRRATPRDQFQRTRRSRREVWSPPGRPPSSSGGRSSDPQTSGAHLSRSRPRREP